MLIIACIVAVYFVALNSVLQSKLEDIKEPAAAYSETTQLATASAETEGNAAGTAEPEPPAPEPPAPEGIVGELAVGNVVTFGSYEQDADLDNGKEPLEWDVIGQDGDRYLLITHYVIDGKSFSDKTSDHIIQANDDATAKQLTWAKSSIRRWLNNDFFVDAFAGCDQSVILQTHVHTSNFRYVAGYVSETYAHLSDSELKKMDSIGGDDTDDYVFLLSVEEFAENFQPVNPWYGKKQCGRAIVSPTEYAKEQGVKSKKLTTVFEAPGDQEGLSNVYVEEIQPYVGKDYVENGEICSWITRTPGVYQGGSAVVLITSDYSCFDPAAAKGAVNGIRPAIWVEG